MRVVVGSENPVKVKAVERAFGHYFEDLAVEGVSVDSGVPDQPVGDETVQGAKNRARALLTPRPDADFSVGLEGGGACAFFTRGVFTRTDQYYTSLLMALAPFNRAELF